MLPGHDYSSLLSDTIGSAMKSLDLLRGDALTTRSVVETAHMIIDAVLSGHKLLICGNGGSAADAQHMAAEFVGRFREDRIPLPALALSTDSSVLTAISNDYSYKFLFSRQVEAHGKEGDVLFGISTSGNSENVKYALETAGKIGISTVLLTGNRETNILPPADILIKVPSTDTPRIQEMHLIIEHVICEMVERNLCG
jgi:D-sedoheptulose 7-phosphate isomerase